MKVQSFKSLMFIGVCVWGTTGAVAFWAGKSMGSHAASTAAKSKVATGKGMLNFVSGSASTKDPGAPVDSDLLAMKGRLDPADVARWAASLSPGQYADEMAKLQGQPAGSKRDAMLTALYGVWAKTNPQEFLQNSSKMTNPTARAAATTEALASWGQKDALSALSWLKSNPGITAAQDDQERLSILKGFAAGNPTDAFAYVNALADTDPLKSSAINALIAGMAQTGDFDKMLPMLDTLPPTMQNAAYAQFLAQWASDSPSDAAKWISGLDPATYQRQMGQYSQTLLASWASSDPLAAAQWAAQQDASNLANGVNTGRGGRGGPGGAGGPGGGGRGGNLLATTISDWVSAGGVDDAGQYLNNLPASPSKDSATATFVRSVMTDDPNSAMTWAKTITDPNQQIASMDTVARTWNAQDPNGFSQYLSTLDPAIASQLQTAAQQAGGRGFGLAGAGGPGGPGGPGGGLVGGGATGGGRAARAQATGAGSVITSTGAGRRGGGTGGRRGGGGGGGGG